MKCPCWGAAELLHDTRDMPYTYKGESTTITAVTGDFCPACSEVVFNREYGDRYSELIGQFQRQVNAAYVDPDHAHPCTHGIWSHRGGGQCVQAAPGPGA